ncbi:MAG TPA: Gfo/Idh/MocA family oxidoreductase [Phycisphaerales bacterium]|nr:Gfo/Idh/MocA family oxidoreductase [Phycisphaerales bacterium]
MKLGMVGGGQGAFIGAVHRMAARLDYRYELVAGALSSTPEKSVASGRELGLAVDRSYPTWQAMLEGEQRRPADDRIEAVSIVTPNHAHFEPAKAFAAAGFHVILDKPMVHTMEQAEDLARTVRENDVVFAVTYNYSGYPLVKQAREMVRSGELGEVRKVVVEYNQGWLAGKLEATGQKQADWRTDPARSGVGGCIGDIGSHCEQLLGYITGLEMESLCADLTTFVPGRKLDDDANVLLRFKPSRGGEPARGILFASQICVGGENDLRIRVWGTKGGLAWHQEDPNALLVHRLGQPDQVYRRANGYLGQAAARSTRIPSGHPEAFIEAFANIYTAAADAIRAGAGAKGPEQFDFPGVYDGARGVRFIHRTVESARASEKWTPFAG